MRMICTFALTLAVFFTSCECSYQSADNPHSERYPGTSSSSPRQQHAPDRMSLEEPPVRGISRSPASTAAAIKILGYSRKELGYIRLISRTNASLKFELRRYYFPVGKLLRLREETNTRVPISTQEHIVLSQSNGYIFAILDQSGFICDIYRADGDHQRVKINMITGDVEDLLPDEIRDCPAGKFHSNSPRNFKKALANYDSLQSVWNGQSGL